MLVVVEDFQTNDMSDKYLVAYDLDDVDSERIGRGFALDDVSVDYA